MIRPLISPTTTVRVCQAIPLDNTYTDTILFTSPSQQENYFASKTKKTYTNLTYQRLASNSAKWALYLPDVADYFYDCNYVAFCNSGFSSKWLYAFISDILYINENCTAITFEIDVMQTWLFDFEIKTSFIERMHVADDTISRNVVEEGLYFMPRYEYYKVERSGIFESAPRANSSTGNFVPSVNYASVILVQTVEDVDEEESIMEGELIQNTYQGLKYIAFDANASTGVPPLNEWLKKMNEAGKAGAIQTISMCPREGLVLTPEGNGKYKVSPEFAMDTIAEKEYEINYTTLDDDYKPKNNKLFCYPYHFFSITTLDGRSYDYRYEDIIEDEPVGNTNMKFKFKMAFGSDPTYFMYPAYYMKCDNNFDYGVKLTGFPKCNWIFGTWENFYAQNQTSQMLTLINSAIGGLQSTFNATVNAPAGSQLDTAMLSTLNAGVDFLQTGISMYGSNSVIRSQPDQSCGASNVGGVNYNLETMDFWIIHKRLHWGFVVKLDDYFWKYGYKVNATGVPNLHTRKYWNYIKLVKPTITGNMTVGDMAKIKTILSAGITFWHTTDVGNYSLPNNEGVLGH